MNFLLRRCRWALLLIPPALIPPARGGEAPRSFAVGDHVRLRLGGGHGVWLAAHGYAWDDMLDAQNAGSVELMRRLVERGDVIYAENGTPGVVVRRSFGSSLVRVTDGPFRGEEGWVQQERIAPFDSPPPAPAEPRPAAPAPPSRAATALAGARNLERSGQPRAALGAYGRVVRDFPGTPEARAAEARARALRRK